MPKSAPHLLSQKPDLADEERLLKLFWNRAELKKEFAKLRREGENLKEKLQQQEGATLRAQQRLEQLEGMLADPLQAANASVFYQLRGVWASCKRKLVRLSKDLTVHQSDREQQAQVAKHQATLRASAHVIDRQIEKAQQRENELIEELRQLHERHAQMRGFWNFFKRRTLLAEVAKLETDLQVSQTHTERCRAAKAEKLAEQGPQFEGLSVAGRRKINMALIAIAQEMFIHFSQRNISVLAREASVRQVTDVNYGNIEVCRELNVMIAKCMRSLPVGDELVVSVRRRAQYLEKQAAYRMETDTVPVAGSFSNIQLKLEDGSVTLGRKSVPVNVLAEEYWDIYTVLQT
ncbi:MAG: hypothetical protein KJO13_10290 [Gammaproteobacteria bacterium]|nr:hypothetical protein [Gammaproteobacteria bacterium]